MINTYLPTEWMDLSVAVAQQDVLSPLSTYIGRSLRLCASTDCTLHNSMDRKSSPSSRVAGYLGRK